MKVKILKRDFDVAVKEPWSSQSCLLAQAAIRQGIRGFGNSPGSAALRLSYVHPLGKLMSKFDRHFKKPGDERKKDMQNLREQLPVTVEYTP